MKLKSSILFLFMMVLSATVSAKVVDATTACTVASHFFALKYNHTPESLSPVVAYTAPSLRNENGSAPSFYVVNFESEGFVIVAGDDRVQPILAFSNEGAFVAENIPAHIRFFLDGYTEGIQYMVENQRDGNEVVRQQWETLLTGTAIAPKDGDGDVVVGPLLGDNSWNQTMYYNDLCPADATGHPAYGGHAAVGCGALVMGQVMRYWQFPTTGTGSHSYNSSYGVLSANFGATTYHYENMPDQLSSVNHPDSCVEAVATLLYHCGVAVNMNYGSSVSVANSNRIVSALSTYFRYPTTVQYLERGSLSSAVWLNYLKNELDEGAPFMYGGSGNYGGHVWICDGYQDDDFFHFNWGWSGQYNNTYYSIDALNTGNGSFNTYQRVILNMIPDYIYDVMVPAITTMTAAPEDAITKTVVVSFTLPTQSMSGAALASAEQVVLKRDGVTIHTFTNVQAGDVMTYEDAVADYGAYEYTIVGYNNNLEGEEFSQVAIVGPNCTWKLVGTTTNFQGWNGGALQFIGANGVVFKTVTMANSTPLSVKFQMPEGGFTLNWVAPNTAVQTMTFTLKDSANQNAYAFSGSSTQLNGTIYSGNNDCPNCTAPTGFTGEFTYQGGQSGAHLTWNCDYSPSKFKIYRSNDGDEYVEIGNVTGDVHEYFDAVANGTYYYKVTAYSSACESNYALTSGNIDYVVVMVAAVAENSINARIYPNPTNGNLRIEAQDLNTVEVYNLVGQKVYEENINGDECVINMKEFESGIYMVKIQALNGSTTQKISVIE